MNQRCFFFINFVLQIVLISIISPTTKSDFIQNCPFIYTVDLSESILLPNKSYLYNNETVIPPQYVQDYNYTILIRTPNIKNVKTHKRGCICAAKQCLPFCSDNLERFYDNFKSDGVDNDFVKNITLSNGNVKRKHLLRDFHPIYEKVCGDMKKAYMLMPELMPYNEWSLYENSMLLRHFDQRNLTITEYCFDVRIINTEYEFVINPVVCGETIDIPWFKIWAMAFSIPFLLITIICYCTLASSNFSHSRCFVTYLLFVSVSYTLICFYSISNINLPYIYCQIFGFLVYYTIVGYLTWTCILSYDTWKLLTNINESQTSFATYSLIGWLLPLLMTFLTLLAQVSNIPDPWKPGITADTCAVNTLRWSAVIYYFIPCIFVFIFCLILYLWIVIYKKRHNDELLAVFGRGPEPILERFVMFFRIFIFMGISWALDIISYFFRMTFGSEDYFIYWALDIFNALHGFLIFLAFICRPSVLQKFKKVFVSALNSSRLMK